MTDREALLQAIREHPDEDTPRLIYADAIEDDGEHDRAAFIRLQVQMARIEQWIEKPGQVMACDGAGRFIPYDERNAAARIPVAVSKGLPNPEYAKLQKEADALLDPNIDAWSGVLARRRSTILRQLCWYVFPTAVRHLISARVQPTVCTFRLPPRPAPSRMFAFK